MKFNIRILASALIALGLVSSCRQAETTTLPRDNWDDEVYASLCSLIDSVGIRSASYDPDCRPYAVFDFDNTTIMNDIELTMMEYGISNMCFVADKDSMYNLIMDGLKDKEQILDMKDGRQLRAADLAMDIADDFKVIRPLDPAEIREMPEFLDFRAKLSAMYYAVARSVEALDASAWLLHLIKGMTPEQIRQVARDAAQYGLGKGYLERCTWESPEMGRTGKVSISFDSGMAQPVEMIHLYQTLRANGIDVYIVSASLEDIVESLACNSEYGYDLPAENVWGMRQPLDEQGRFTGFFREDYTPTLEDGKSVDILRFIAPLHGNKGPALVAGDSNGDYSMLSSFCDLGRGLIIDRNMPEPLCTLYDKPGYLLQGRDPATGSFIRSHRSNPVK